MALNRVTPPSATDSYTTSAEFRPVCGRDSGEFSTLIESGRRVIAAASGATSPLSGHSTGSGGRGTTRSLSAIGHADVTSAGGLGRQPVGSSSTMTNRAAVATSERVEP